MAEGVDGYKIGIAEFRGRTLAHLEHIQGDIKKIEKDLKTKACKDDVNSLKADIAGVKKRIDNIKLTSAVIGAVGGLLATIGTVFGLKKL